MPANRVTNGRTVSHRPRNPNDVGGRKKRSPSRGEGLRRTGGPEPEGPGSFDQVRQDFGRYFRKFAVVASVPWKATAGVPPAVPRSASGAAGAGAEPQTQTTE